MILAFVLLAIGGVLALLLVGGDTVAGLPAADVATLAYAAIWGGVIAAGLLFAARANPGRTLRHALVWAAGFVLLIAVYAYGAEFRAIGERVLAALVPGRGVSIAEGRVLATRGRDGHFQIEAEVNGRPVRFLVDTGASIVALGRDTAEAIGIDTGALRYTLPIQTANGRTMAAPVRLDSVAVGGIERRNVQAAVAADEGLGVDLLGMSFLGRLTAFEFRGDRLVLTD